MSRVGEFKFKMSEREFFRFRVCGLGCQCGAEGQHQSPEMCRLYCSVTLKSPRIVARRLSGEENGDLKSDVFSKGEKVT